MMILYFLISIQPETVALGVHLGQAALVALLADLGQVTGVFIILCFGQRSEVPGS